MVTDLFQPLHLLILFAIVLVVVGPRRAVRLARGVGDGLGKMTRYRQELREGFTSALTGEEEGGRKKER